MDGVWRKQAEGPSGPAAVIHIFARPPGGPRDSGGPARRNLAHLPPSGRVYTKPPPHRIPRVDAARKMGGKSEIADASTSRPHCNAVFMQTRLIKKTSKRNNLLLKKNGFSILLVFGSENVYLCICSNNTIWQRTISKGTFGY